MDKKRKVVIDCDPGIDDCFALMLCIRYLDVQGIVAVGGNTGLEYTERNARFITELTGRTDIPVYAGYDMPMFTKCVRATEVHGSGGVGDVEIVVQNKKLEPRHGTDYLIDMFMNHDDVSLITLGPLTNVAQALLKEPRLKERIPEILCMGGSATAGNATPAAEFNIYVDPEAAKIVFESGISIKMVGLNLTRQNHLAEKEAAEIEAIGGKVAEFAAKILRFASAQLGVSNLCDAAAVSWWTQPDVITKSLMAHVDVETQGEFTKGMTLCDWRDYMGTEPSVDISRTRVCELYPNPYNVEVAMEFNRERFLEMLYDTMRWYKEQD